MSHLDDIKKFLDSPFEQITDELFDKVEKILDSKIYIKNRQFLLNKIYNYNCFKNKFINDHIVLDKYNIDSTGKTLYIDKYSSVFDDKMNFIGTCYEYDEYHQPMIFFFDKNIN